MLACLSPNGMNRYEGASAPDRLLIATSSGVTITVLFGSLFTVSSSCKV